MQITRIYRSLVIMPLVTTARFWGMLLSAVLFLTAHVEAHPHHHPHPGHNAPTYEVSPPAVVPAGTRRLVLRIVDGQSGKQTAARFGLTIDGQLYIPEALGEHGLRFVSIHQAKKQRATVLYARGTGTVELALPRGARRGELFVTKGYEVLSQQVPFEIVSDVTNLEVRLQRWSDLRSRGWLPAEEHLHYERTDAAHDADWLTILDAEDLVHAHFLVLKGGNLPGIWAQQYAYGKKGQAGDGGRLIVPGEEFRGRRQGHINLLGIGAVIEPISIGAMGSPPHPYNYPALHDVFLEARRGGGIGGPAHGGSLAGNSTAVVDTVLGAAEFFEIANTHLYRIDLWYRLLNCGYLIPPAAGTDLPNFPFRDRWQPLLGETRMYVRTAEARDFESWKAAVRRGEVFVSSGPMIHFEVNGAGPGKTVHLPTGGGWLSIKAELASQQPLQSLEIVCNGRPLDVQIVETEAGGVHRWKVRQRLRITESCWLAARGTGPAKQALAKHTGIEQNAMAHTAAIGVVVGDTPITSPDDATFLIDELARNQEAYRSAGRFAKDEHRKRMLELFESAIGRLQPQTQ